VNPGGSIVKLSEFLCSPPGRYVLDWEQLHLDAAVVDIFGYHALQLGLPEIDALRENRMPLRFCAADRQLEVGAEKGQRRVAIINRYDELPFATHSIDLVVMPHILEFAPDPHQVLREVERVLVPEGHVVITGFNPASMWGLRQFCTRLAQVAVVRLRAWPLWLLRPVGALGHLAQSLALHGEGRRSLVARAGRRLHADRGETRARHAAGGQGLEEHRGTSAAADAGGNHAHRAGDR
jgi:SAM-dependent methyltransferase